MKILWSMALVPLLSLSSCDSIKKRLKTAAKPPDGAPVETSSKVEILTSESYSDFIQQPGKLVVVDFYADWCGPCRMLSPMLAKMSGEFSEQATVGKLNVDHAQNISRQAGVEGIPDIRFFIDGKEVDRIVGLPPERELRAAFERHAGTATKSSTPPSEPPANPVPPPTKPQESPAGPPAKATAQEKQDKPAQEPAKEPAKPKQPPIQPMKKDWMPPGIEKR